MKSSATAPMSWPTALMRYRTDQDVLADRAIQKREREPAQWHQSTPLQGRRSESRVLNDQASRSLELVEKRFRNGGAGLIAVVGGGLIQFFLRVRAERPTYASFARTRASAASPGTHATWPLAMAASRRSASLAQAASHSGSVSRLAMSLSSRRERSSAGKPKTSASRISTGMVMASVQGIFRRNCRRNGGKGQR